MKKYIFVIMIFLGNTGWSNTIDPAPTPVIAWVMKNIPQNLKKSHSSPSDQIEFLLKMDHRPFSDQEIVAAVLEME